MVWYHNSNISPKNFHRRNYGNNKEREVYLARFFHMHSIYDVKVKGGSKKKKKHI